MILDTEKQRHIILELLGAANFSGKCVDALYEFKQEVVKAEVQEEKTPPANDAGNRGL